MIDLGMNGRFFPNNWRSAVAEIGYAQRAGFRCIQFPGPLTGLDEARLGDTPAVVGEALRQAGMYGVMEIVIHVDSDGLTKLKTTPLDVLKANLPAIDALGCRCVHWHLAPHPPIPAETRHRLEVAWVPQFVEAVALAKAHGFVFGVEHNEPEITLFSDPESCAAVLTAVPDLHLVWDVNHASPEQMAGYKALIPRMSMLHVSDTLLPETNYHLPLGLGNMDFMALTAALQQGGFSGPAILEIGGLPKSGGYGRDTDEALVESRKVWETAVGKTAVG